MVLPLASPPLCCFPFLLLAPCQNRVLQEHKQGRFSLVCLFSVTMWIHVNVGDERFLDTLSRICDMTSACFAARVCVRVFVCLCVCVFACAFVCAVASIRY